MGNKKIDNFDMSDYSLYFADVLKILVEKFNIKSITRGKIAFSSLDELINFPIPINTSNIFVFDTKEYKEIDLSQLKVFGFSSINFNVSRDVYEVFRAFDESFFFPSIINRGEELYRVIIGNSSFKRILFYTPIVKNRLDEQIQVNVKIPETLDF